MNNDSMRSRLSRSPSDDFVARLRAETVVMGHLKSIILAGVFAVGLTASVLLVVTGSRLGPITGRPRTPIVSIAAVLGSLVALELLLARYLTRLKAAGRTPPRFVWHASGLMEITAPTLLILLVSATSDEPLLALTSPVTGLYFAFIVLSTLILDPWIALGSGAMAALQYSLAAAYLVVSSPSVLGVGDPRLTTPLFHAEKALILLLVGVVAAFVTHEIRRRVLRTFELGRERQGILSVFGQLTAPDVVDALLAAEGPPATERRRVTILFADVRGYSSFAEKAPPEEVVRFLNRLFDVMIAAVNRQGGIVHQLLGDGLMAIFGAPVSREDHARAGLDAAEDMAAAVESLVRRGGLPDTRLGIGIHTGEVVAGLVGSSIHREYKVTGDVVNVAARIEKLNKRFDAKVLCSAAVIEASGRDPRTARDLGEVGLEGRAEPVHLYRLA